MLQASPFAQLRQVTLPDAGQVRLVTRIRIEVVHCPPERGEGAAGAGVVPDAGGDQSAGPGDPCHLRQSRYGIGHEVHDELGEGHVEDVVRKRKILGNTGPHVDLREARPDRSDEWGRWVDRRDDA